MISLPRLPQCLLIAAVLLHSQYLRVPSSDSDRSTPGQFFIVLDSPPAKAPVALQWEMSVPPAIIIGQRDITIGKAAAIAGKSLTCAVKKNPADPRGAVRYVCILAGGKDPLANGPVATFRYRAQTEVGKAPIRVAIEKVLGVSADLKRIEIANTDAMIRIR